MKAGQIYPVAFFPLLREDSARGRIALQVRMSEALHTIINPIKVRASVYLVPKSAMVRFNGSMETVDRSYMNEPMPDGSAPPPWKVVDPRIADTVDGSGHGIFDVLGVHYKNTDRLDGDVTESYNCIVNWRRAAVSAALPKNTLTDHRLAPAFWNAWKFQYIKPSFDAAMMEGAVPVSYVDPGYAAVRGFGISTTNPPANKTARVSDGETWGPAPGWDIKPGTAVAGEAGAVIFEDPDSLLNPAIYADLRSAGGVISLADIRMAEKMQSFAKKREQYQGIPSEYLIEMLMRGLRIPPYQLMEPILIGLQETTIGQTERYATDGASLETSVTNGVAQLSLPINTPAIEPGGLIMVLMEIVPEQLYERMNDDYLEVNANGDRADEPDFLVDFNDPQKVQAVTNRRSDILHGSPNQIFGYEPLNFEWQRNFARVGGKYRRPFDDAFVEDRQRIWAVEKTDPTLSDDFYLCPQPFPHTVFADALADPFEVIVVGSVTMTGLTHFGGAFEEDGDHYEKLMAQMDAERLESLPPGSPATSGEVADTKPAAQGDEEVVVVERVDAKPEGKTK
jgi:hypothetical protein